MTTRRIRGPTRMIALRLPSDLDEWLRAIAEKEDATLTGVVSRLLRKAHDEVKHGVRQVSRSETWNESNEDFSPLRWELKRLSRAAEKLATGHRSKYFVEAIQLLDHKSVDDVRNDPTEAEAVQLDEIAHLLRTAMNRANHLQARGFDETQIVNDPSILDSMRALALQARELHQPRSA